MEQIKEQPPLPFLLPKKMEVEEDTWVPLVNSDPFVSSPRNLLATPTRHSHRAVTHHRHRVLRVQLAAAAVSVQEGCKVNGSNEASR